MQRMTITVDDDLMAELDELIGRRGYTGRSEAIRDLTRAGIQQALLEADAAPDCVAAVVYVYDHATRDLSRRLSRLFHDHHGLSVATTHVHLNHESGLEVALLKGRTREVRALADAVLAQRGVRHGRLIIVPVVESADEHSHDGHVHSHVRAR